MSALSVHKELAGRSILLTGASGFVGKVLLSMMLTDHPDIERVYVLLRPNRTGDAEERLDHILNHSPALTPLHALPLDEQRQRIRCLIPIDGDVSNPFMGIDRAGLREMADVDLVIHCAGLVDFEPDVDLAVRANVLGALHAAEVAEAIDARLVHISTCFVAGRGRRVRPRVVRPGARTQRRPASGRLGVGAHLRCL